METQKQVNKHYTIYDRKTILMYLMFIFTIISLPGNVKCQMGETIASLFLFIIITIFIFAAIGFWSRRQENK
jgi:hypothetical protein